MAGNQLNATAIAAATRVAFPRPMSTISTPKIESNVLSVLATFLDARMRAPVDLFLL
jgi:hypothetical protein